MSILEYIEFHKIIQAKYRNKEIYQKGRKLYNYWSGNHETIIKSMKHDILTSKIETILIGGKTVKYTQVDNIGSFGNGVGEDYHFTKTQIQYANYLLLYNCSNLLNEYGDIMNKNRNKERLFLNVGITIQIITIFLGLKIILSGFKFYLSFSTLIIIVISGFVIYFLYGYYSVNNTKLEKNKYKLVRRSIILCFILYITVLFIVIFLKSAMGLYYDTDDYIVFLKNNFNLIPLSTIRFYFSSFFRGSISLKSLLYNLIGNSIIFIPVGFFLYILFPHLRILRKYFKLLSIIIILIEIIQILTMTGYMDIDDFILNLFGCIVVFHFLKNNNIENILKKYYFIQI